MAEENEKIKIGFVKESNTLCIYSENRIKFKQIANIDFIFSVEFKDISRIRDLYKFLKDKESVILNKWKMKIDNIIIIDKDKDKATFIAALDVALENIDLQKKILFDWKNITFKNTVDMSFNTKGMIVTMNKCEFQGYAYFNNSKFHGFTDFCGAKFKNNVDFKDCVFDISANFSDCEFQGYVFFDNSKFENSAYFYKAKFENNVYFDNSIFNKSADFRVANFEKAANFYGVTFNKTPNFSQAIFNGSLNLVNTNLNFDFDSVKDKINEEYEYRNADKQENENIEIENVANDFRDSFRNFKSALIKDNNLLDASNFHKVELYCKEIELEYKKPPIFSKDWIDKIQLLFYRYISDHHTNLVKIIHNTIRMIGLFAWPFFIANLDSVNSFLDNFNHSSHRCFYALLIMLMLMAIIGLFVFLCFLIKPLRALINVFMYSGFIGLIWINPKYIFGIANLFNSTKQITPFQNILMTIYSIVAFIFIFSLQKTARRNSIIPN